jgi:hypothetical protein
MDFIIALMMTRRHVGQGADAPGDDSAEKVVELHEGGSLSGVFQEESLVAQNALADVAEARPAFGSSRMLLLDAARIRGAARTGVVDSSWSVRYVTLRNGIRM